MAARPAKTFTAVIGSRGEIRSFTAGAERDMLSSHISPIQIETLRHCIRGFTYREIADRFGLSVSGVRRNISDMIEKERTSRA